MFADEPIRCLGSKSDPGHLIGSAKSINQHIAPRGFPIWPALPDCRLQLQKNRKPPDPGYPKPDYEANFFAAFLPSKFFNSVPENMQEIVFNFN
jgi:hypothetical protein